MNKKLILAALAVTALVPAAQAANLEFVGAVSGKSKAVTINYNGDSMNVNAGALGIKVDGGSIIEAYCVDLEHSIQAGWDWDVNILSFDSHPATAANLIKAKNLLASTYFGVDTDNKGAALQLAVWDALYDGGDGLNTGVFEATVSGGLATAYNSIVTTANTPTENINDYIFTYYEATSHGQYGKKYQDLVSLEPVPEPATMVLLGGMALAALRKRKQAN